MAAASAPRLHAQQPIQTAPEIRDIRVTGVRALPPAVVQSALALQPTRCRSPLFFIACLLGVEGTLERAHLVDPADVQLDADRIGQLYEFWGYPQATAEPRITGDARSVRIEYVVTEGEPLLVRSVQLIWPEGMAPPPLPDPLPLSTGEPYAGPRIAVTEELIRDALAELGYPQPQIEVGGDVGAVADVVITITPGRAAVFEAPDLQLAAPLDESFIRPRLALQPGMPYRLSTLERMEAELYTLPIVEQVFTGTRALPGDTVVYPTVRVLTRRRLGYEVGGTLSSARCLELGAAARDRYALGGPRMLTASVSFSNLLARQVGGSFPCAAPVAGAYADPDYRVQLELLQPWVGDARTSLLFRGFARRETSPLVYVQRGFGGEAGVTRELGQQVGGLTAYLGYAPRRDELDAVALYFCANHALCTPAEIAGFAAPRWLAPGQLTLRTTTPGYTRILRPPPLAAFDWLPQPVPRLRHRASLLLDGAAGWTGSDYTYARAQLEGALTRTFGRDLDVAARVRTAAITGDGVLPPQVRLFSGGVVSVRGVAQNMLGPIMAVVAPDAVPPDCVEPPCDFGLLDLDGRSLRPAGGDRVVEANLETRLWVRDGLQLAAFADFGWLGRRAPIAGGIGDDVRSAAVVTPGLGVRVLAPVGPIRIDLAYDPRRPRRYPVFTEAADGSVILAGTGVFDPFTFDAPGGFREFVRRLQLQLAVGQAF